MRYGTERCLKAISDGIGLPGFAGPAAASRTPTIQQLTAKSEQYRHYLPTSFLAWFDLDDAPALHRTSGGAVPTNALHSLLYLQLPPPDAEALHPEVEQALTLIETDTADSRALTLYRGWRNDGAKVKHARLLPFISSLADDQLVPQNG